MGEHVSSLQTLYFYYKGLWRSGLVFRWETVSWIYRLHEDTKGRLVHSSAKSPFLILHVWRKKFGPRSFTWSAVESKTLCKTIIMQARLAMSALSSGTTWFSKRWRWRILRVGLRVHLPFIHMGAAISYDRFLLGHLTVFVCVFSFLFFFMIFRMLNWSVTWIRQKKCGVVAAFIPYLCPLSCFSSFCVI